MKAPELSIIIPAYNCSQSIKQIVSSIINQSYTDFELIIVNDHSTDNTSDVLRELAKTDDRIRIINQRQNGGASVARNTGIKQSQGKYIMFFDADDDIRPNTLNTFVSTIKKCNCELVVSGFTVVNIKNNQPINSVDVCTNPLPKQQRGETWRLYILKLLGLDGRLYQVWNKIYLAEIIKNNKLQFQKGINFGEDLLFNLDYLACITKGIKFIQKPLYIYKQSLDAGTFSKSSLIYENRLQNYQALEKFMSTEPNTIEKQSLLNWIKYNWMYSHLLAISSSTMTLAKKKVAIEAMADIDGHVPYSNKDIIGQKRILIEKFLNFSIRHPRLALCSIKISSRLKNNRLTASLWQRLRRNINR